MIDMRSTTPMLREKLLNPFVIQCQKCNTTLGDSFSLLDFKHDMLVLNSSSSTVALENVQQNGSAYDNNCIYQNLRCRCDAIVGKKYVTVNKECNGFAGKYCFMKEYVYSYALGSNSKPGEITLSGVVEELEMLQKFCMYIFDIINKEK